MKFRIIVAGTVFKQLILAGPGVWEHPTAAAKASKEDKEGLGEEEVGAPESMTPARKGVSRRSRTTARPTEAAPAD